MKLNNYSVCQIPRFVETNNYRLSKIAQWGSSSFLLIAIIINVIE
jgi:hypothetical protein